MRVFAIPSFLLWSLCVAAAQSTLPAPVKVDDPLVYEHRIGPEEVLHRSQREIDGFKSSTDPRFRLAGAGMGSCSFELVVSTGGLVESATLKPPDRFEDSCSPHQQEAESIIRARRYEPWLIDGQPARVQIEDYVQVLPPERWGPHVAFPEKVDRSTLVFTLERTSCYGSCPAYTVSIAGDGTVSYEGFTSVGLAGHHTTHVEESTVTGLLDRFRAANFLSALPSYRASMTDNPTHTLTLSMNGQTKKVVDYVGVNAGLPWAIEELEDAIDEAAETHRWVKAKADVLAVLEQEKWNFAADSADNLRIYREAIGRGDAPLIQKFLKAHAPVLSSAGDGVPPVCMAARAGNVELTEEMLRGNKNVPATVRDRCLVDAAMSGEMEMLSFWLDHGADPEATIAGPTDPKDIHDVGDWFEQQGLLANAARSGNADLLRRVVEFKTDVNATVQNEPLLQWTMERAPAKSKTGVVEVLLAAGADPNAKDWMGETALFKCDSGENLELIEPLLHAGAQIDARDQNGSTPLIRHAFIEAFVKKLLADGADPSLTNHRGETALSTAKQYMCPACVKLIQDALERKSGAAAKPN